MNTQTTQEPIFTVYGNMGSDPTERTIEARTCTKTVFNPVIDGPEERTWEQPEINFLTFSVATGGYDDKPLVWIPCVDWDGFALRSRKGDQVEVNGYFEFRTYTDKRSGQEKTIRQLVVTNFRIRKPKIRHEVD